MFHTTKKCIMYFETIREIYPPRIKKRWSINPGYISQRNIKLILIFRINYVSFFRLLKLTLFHPTTVLSKHATYMRTCSVINLPDDNKSCHSIALSWREHKSCWTWTDLVSALLVLNFQCRETINNSCLQSATAICNCNLVFNYISILLKYWDCWVYIH